MLRLVTLSSKNQITLPSELIGYLKIEPRTQLLLESVKGEIRVKPLKPSIVGKTAGSLTKHVVKSKLGVPFAKIMTETKRIVTKELAIV